VALLPRPAAVLFDLDGTLVDTVGTRIDAWMRAFGESDIEADRSFVAALIGSDGKRLVREVAERAGMPIDDGRAEQLDHRSGEIYSGLNTDPQPLPGVGSFLDALEERGIPWVVATSSRRAQVGRSIDALERPNEPRIVDGSSVEHAKPAPDLMLAAAQELGVPPSECWYVGDSTWDMRAAVAAEMTPIAVLAGSAVTPHDLREAGAVYCVPRISDLVDVLPR
jgi:HAD superfamily hydrolase (TIGR01509 family)